MSRWISMVRPDCLPRTASRAVRDGVAPGSMLYSAVSQPRPEPRSQPGTPSLSDAVQKTCVSPSSMRAEPAANLATAGVMLHRPELVGLASFSHVFLLAAGGGCGRSGGRSCKSEQLAAPAHHEEQGAGPA